jgi:signal-induced proliferation-associated 1 like protein 3
VVVPVVPVVVVPVVPVVVPVVVVPVVVPVVVVPVVSVPVPVPVVVNVDVAPLGDGWLLASASTSWATDASFCTVRDSPVVVLVRTTVLPTESITTSAGRGAPVTTDAPGRVPIPVVSAVGCAVPVPRTTRPVVGSTVAGMPKALSSDATAVLEIAGSAFSRCSVMSLTVPS